MKNSFRLTGRKHVRVALFACAIAFLPWAARSATWNVGDYAALTNAIACSTNGDTIAISQNITASNAVEISEKGLTIEGNDYSISVPVPGFDESGITNGNRASTFGVFFINAGDETNFIRNLTVKGGNAAGAINNASGTLVLEDMTIAQSGGPSEGGGGVVNSGTLYLQNCNVSRNGAQYGGGFVNYGTMFIEDCTFSENRSLSSGGGGGGGVNYGGYLYANNSTFAHNKSTELGGAFENYSGSGESFFVDCTFAGNIAYNTSALLKGGAIAQVASAGSVIVVNSLFAYNYWNNSGTYELNDLHYYSGAGSTKAYYCAFHSTMDQLGISVSNTLYAGATNGSDDSIFAGGANAIVLDAGGVPIGTNTIYQPFLVRLTATNLPTALLQSNASPSFAAGKGCRAAFSSSQTTPVVGYYSNNTQWVDLSGADSSNFEVLDDQNGTNRTNSLIVGAAVGIASNLFMLKVVATNGGTVSGATVYGDIYPSGTVVTVTAIPAVSNLFVRWDYALGGSGTASSNNPFQVAVTTNTTLLPVFTNFDGFTITYSGNGYTGGTVPSQQVVTNGGSTNISGPGAMVKEGYNFSCWNTRSDGNGTDYASDAGYSGPDNLMLYAKWSLVAQMAVLGTNGAAIASGEPASTAKGTDFGAISWGATLTNTFAITNFGAATLTISGVTTNGDGASAFSIFNFPFSIEAGTVSNFNIRFAPANAGTYTAAVQIANNSTNTPYIVYLAGTGAKYDQTITNFPNPGDQSITNTVHLSAQASSGLPVSFTNLSGSPVSWQNATSITFIATGQVSIIASQAGDTNWNAAPSVTNTFNVTRAEQAALTFNPASPQTYNTTNALSASGGSGTGALSYAVVDGPGQILDTNNLVVTSGTGLVTVVATKAADDLYNSLAATALVAAAHADQTITNFTNPGDQLTTNVVQLSAQASSGLSVSFTNLVGSPVSWASATTITFTATGEVSIIASQAGDTNWNAALDVTNTFNVLPPPVLDGWLALTVTPEGGIWRLSAPAGYTGPTAGTGNLAAVSAVTGAYGIAWGAMTGYTAPSNQPQFVTGGSTSLFTGIYLQISTNIGTPTGVSATEGNYTNKIRVTWNGVAGAAGYEIWRNQTNDPTTAGWIADIPLITVSSERLVVSGGKKVCRKVSDQPSASSEQPTALSLSYDYDDYAINPIYAYYYWVRAKTATLISPMSYVGMGYAALSPEQDNGTVDIGVTDLVFLPVNILRSANPGTVSCRVQNYGPDALAGAAVRFDFYMGASVWVGDATESLTLSAGQETLMILTLSGRQGIAVREDLSGTCVPEVRVRHLTALNDPNLTNNTTQNIGVVRVKVTGANSPGRSVNDYDGDGRSDLALKSVNMDALGVVYSGYRYRTQASMDMEAMGWLNVAGDYDGDGKTDVALYEPNGGCWDAQLSSQSGQVATIQLGGAGIVPVPADYDGDRKTDPAVYWAAMGYWRGALSGAGYQTYYGPWVGGVGYEPAMADYDGDGKADLVTYAPDTGHWLGRMSGTHYELVEGNFGVPGYQAVPADYDGDGQADLALYDPADGMWYAVLSSSGQLVSSGDPLGGGGGCDAVPADYDGDGLADPAVYERATGIWYGALSSSGYRVILGWFGGPAYQPVLE